MPLGELMKLVYQSKSLFLSTKDMCQFTKLCFGVPTFRFSLQIVWKILYQASTIANNGLKTMFETLVTWFKLFKHLKHHFFPIALPTFQSTYQNCVWMHKLNAKSPTDSWKVHKTQPFQPQCRLDVTDSFYTNKYISIRFKYIILSIIQN